MPHVLPGGLAMFRTSEWGARPAQHDSAATVPTDMVLHHTATPNRPPIARHDAAVQRLFELARTIQADHMNRGFADTGQHFTVSSDGICCEGRHGSLDALLAGRCIRGAHAADSDTGADDNDSWGTEHEGTYGTVQMPRPQWEASVHLHAVIAMRCNLDSATIIGHRDTRCITACPGDAFHARIPQFRADVHRKILELRAAVPV